MKEPAGASVDEMVVEIGADMLEVSRKGTSRRNSQLLVKRKKSRLEDTVWDEVSNKVKDEDWFIHEEIVEESISNKLNLWTVLQLVSLMLDLVALACTFSVSKLEKLTLWDLPLWKWEIFLSVIISGHLLCGWAVRVLVFCIERGFLQKLRVLYFVYGLKKAFQNCMWVVLIVIAWHFLVVEKMVYERESKVLRYLTKSLLCILVASLIWFIKVIIVKILASSFHNKKFFKRITDYLIKQYVIKSLSDSLIGGNSSVSEKAKTTSYFPWGFARKKKQSSNCLHEWSRSYMSNLGKKSVKRLVQGRLIPTLSTMDEDLPDLSDEEDEESSCSYAKKLARKIFKKVAKGSESIRLDDLKCFVAQEKALKSIDLFEGIEEEASINQQSFINWMVEAFKERRYILLSLNDAKTAVEELHRLMNVLVTLLILILWLFLFEIQIGHLLVLVSSQLLVMGFIFGNTCRTVFEAIIFLFIMHPFDVGDRCEVDGVQMVVEEVNILTTVFERYDFQKVTYPNYILATKAIGNYNRSDDMVDQIEFSLHISTPWEKIDAMKEKIKRYIESEHKYWYSKPVIVVKDVQDMNRLIMTVWPRHKMNYQDMVQRWTRRSSLIDGMINIFRELNIEYRMLPLEVNVRSLPGTTSDMFTSNWSTC
ncbi:mechanosensitive ion channel protein 6-like isoform X1 [Lycium ferocissimum]|uniref:mechanosensitive ion channel protein 6-like isoform X1 n=1 Tax=Lycium ferocissimum TaxID=112874 RepID=UPI0028167622|nr:mechanosensitive ion channel protein 6-like isoform X1 [Lycium ferocissimum]